MILLIRFSYFNTILLRLAYFKIIFPCFGFLFHSFWFFCARHFACVCPKSTAEMPPLFMRMLLEAQILWSKVYRVATWPRMRHRLKSLLTASMKEGCRMLQEGLEAIRGRIGSAATPRSPAVIPPEEAQCVADVPEAGFMRRMINRTRTLPRNSVIN